jgi:hypothetical protein
MKKLLLLFLLVLGSSQGFAQQKQITRSISYFPGSYEQFQSLMIEKNKAAIVLFYSDRHGLSKEFTTNLNKDTALVSFIDSHYVAYRVNTNDDYDLPMAFRITDIPSLIILDRNLKEAGRIEGKKETEGLLEILRVAK